MFGRSRSYQIKAKELEIQTYHLAIPLNNVYELLDVDFHRESSNEHDDEFTLKETETQRNTKALVSGNER